MFMRNIHGSPVIISGQISQETILFNHKKLRISGVRHEVVSFSGLTPIYRDLLLFTGIYSYLPEFTPIHPFVPGFTPITNPQIIVSLYLAICQ